jgi:hypothetical protein
MKRKDIMERSRLLFERSSENLNPCLSRRRSSQDSMSFDSSLQTAEFLCRPSQQLTVDGRRIHAVERYPGSGPKDRYPFFFGLGTRPARVNRQLRCPLTGLVIPAPNLAVSAARSKIEVAHSAFDHEGKRWW